MIINVIYLYMIEKYKLESNSIYYFYSYWRNFCPDNEKKPSDFIRFLKEKIDKNTNQYIDDFFSQIAFEIENTKGKTNKEIILKNYHDKDYFFEKLEKKLDISIKRYIGLSIDDEDDEDD